MSMINLSHSSAIFTGGNYTQVTNIHQRNPWDLLQSAAAPSAFHDSGDYFDAPRCHPNTRLAVMSELRDFTLRRGDTGHAKILWLNGAAGAGKSAIARSVCEECSSTNSLLASFFFNRSDPSRNNHRSFVATVTYQVFGNIPRQYKSLILGVIERDPLIFTRSVETQVMALIVTPLHDLFENNYFNTIAKRLIVIDGLDECSNARAQINILAVIQKISQQTDFPFIFLIVSRPENDIQAFFRSPSMAPVLHRLQLNHSYKPHIDIERFLGDKLQEICDTHPLKDSIPRKWPSIESIRALVQKSSGQFMYASLVVKYVTSNRHQPHKRLDYVLKICPPKGDLPFAELDALYSHVLSGAEGDMDLALRIIGYTISGSNFFTIEQLARIARLDPNDCLVALCDLGSVLSVETNQFGERLVRISHKTFPEYLFESARSGIYHVNETQALSELAAKCFRYISDVTYTPESLMTRYDIFAFFHRHKRQLTDNISSSHEDLKSFSLINCYNTFSSPETRSKEETALFNQIFWDNFFFGLLDQLCTLVGTDYAYLYDHYLDEFRKLIDRHPDVYRPYVTKFKAEKVTALVTVLILTEPSGSEVPLRIFRSATSGPATSSELGRHHYWFLSGQLSNLLHDAALQCFKFLKHDVNHSSVAATLRYLTWVLPHAAQSSDLEAACNPPESFVYAATEDPALSDLAQEVGTAMKNYREKFNHAQHRRTQDFNRNASASHLMDSDNSDW